MKIGIGITTRNRPEIAIEALEIFHINRPDDSIICVIDDASVLPPFGFGRCLYNIFRFENHVGVGVAKNKCLELLYDAGCTHFFLFDDDCRPIVNEWWLPYINSGLYHACWNFNRTLIAKHAKNLLRNPPIPVPAYWEYEKPNGCMLYFTKMAIDMVGGWDLQFTGYGYDHVNLSDRIFNNGITPGRYIDVPNTSHLFEMAKCESSFTSHDRSKIPENLKLYQQNYYSKEFKPFK